MDDAFNLAHWWNVWGSKAPYLQGIATKILNLTCSSPGCERNWSAFEWTQSKKRNKLDVQRRNDIIFVQFNSRMKKKENSVKKGDSLMETCEEGDIPNAQDWLEVENGESQGEERMAAWGYTSEVSTSRAKRSLGSEGKKSAKRTKRLSCGASSSRGSKSTLLAIDESESDKELVASEEDSLASDEPETEVSGGDVVLDNDSD